MFLADLVEFGRKVKLNKYYPQVDVTSDARSGIVKNAYKGTYLTGDLDNSNVTGELRTIDNGRVINRNTKLQYPEPSRNLKVYIRKNGKHVGAGYDSATGAPRKMQSVNPDKKPIRKPKSRTTTSPPTINKTNTNPIPKVNTTPISTPPKPKTPVTSSTPSKSKTSSKFLNKYSLGALGAAGVLGAGYMGYRAYQKRKKEDRK